MVEIESFRFFVSLASLRFPSIDGLIRVGVARGTPLPYHESESVFESGHRLHQGRVVNRSMWRGLYAKQLEVKHFEAAGRTGHIFLYGVFFLYEGQMFRSAQGHSPLSACSGRMASLSPAIPMVKCVLYFVR